MRNKNTLAGTLILALALLLATIAYCFASSDAYTAICTRVIDGDTVDLVDANQKIHRIRITGMDAPEISQPYGKQAKAAISELILHKEVYVLPAGIDKYERELATLRLEAIIGQLDVAEVMISNGHAFDWHGQHYKAQEYARENRLGIWSDTSFQERPWFYRRRTQ